MHVSGQNIEGTSCHAWGPQNPPIEPLVTPCSAISYVKCRDMLDITKFSPLGEVNSSGIQTRMT